MKGTNRHGGRRPGAGRKPLAREVRRGRRVLVRLTEDELAALERSAGNEGLSTFIRRVLLRYLARRRAPRK